MCCFNGPVDHVYSTRIFVGARGGSQVTIYQAGLVGTRIEMVLPVRTLGARDLEFIDLKDYPTFFRDCESAFPEPPHKTTSVGASPPPSAGAPLEVHQVGDYKVSFAPSALDLSRADPAVFRLSPRLGAVVAAHYPAEKYGFVIFKPDHNGEMHPLGYRHPVRAGEPLFVPTRHEHGHDGPPDWDHRIYHQGGAAHLPATAHEVSPWPAGQTFAASVAAGRQLPRELDPEQPLRRMVRESRDFANGDLEFSPMTSQGNAGVLAVGAAAAGAAALGYGLLRRRRPAGPAPEQE